MLLIGGIGSAIPITVVVFAPKLPAEWTMALSGMAVLWFTSLYRSYLGVTFRAEAEFRRLTVRNMIEFVLNFGTLVLVAVGGFAGMIARYVLISVVMTMLLHSIRPVRVRPRLLRPDFSTLLATGIPQYFGSYLVTASLAFEQTVLAQRGGVELVGLYAPAAAMSTIMLAIHASIVSYVNPRIVYRLGQRDDPHVVYHGVKIAVSVITAISLPVMIIGLIALPWVTTNLFPRYAAALPATQIALLGGFFLAINATLTGVYALKAWGYVAIYALTAAALRWMLPWLLAQNGADLLARVALGGAIANALVFVIGMVIVRMATQFALRKADRQPVSIASLPMD
jgi:O-antigen/teichoic acid export membrane protein